MDYKYDLINAWESAAFEINGEKANFGDMLVIFHALRKIGKTLFFIGNGGSAAIAAHMTTDFFKNGGFRTIDMLAPPTITCLANDFGYEYVFSKQIESLGQEGDMLVATSSSGESENIINGAKAAKGLGMKVFALTGFSKDNRLRSMGDFSFYVPSGEYGIVESTHNMLLQRIVDELKTGGKRNEFGYMGR